MSDKRSIEDLVEELTRRVAALEAEIAKSHVPAAEYHYHYHTPSQPAPPEVPFMPFHPPSYTGDPPPAMRGNTWRADA